MDLKIIKEQQNLLFDRKEIAATTVEKVVPKREDVMKALAEKYSVPVDAVRILTIKGSFGSREFTINANIYSSKEQRNEHEKLTKKEKELDEKMNAPEPETPVEEPKQEEKVEEEPAPSGVPSEESKTDPPVSVKPESKTDTPVSVKEEPTPEEDKKEKDKSTEEKLNETEIQA